MKIDFKKIKINKLFYPFLLAFILLILSAVFFLSIKYLLIATNRVLVSDEAMLSGNLMTLNLADYNTVAAKIGLPLTVIKTEESGAESEDTNDGLIESEAELPNAPDEIADTSAEIIAVPLIGIDLVTTTASSTAEVSVSLNKQDIKIAVYNGSKKTGLAADLRNSLSVLGFVSISIGNTTTSTQGAVIGIKESASDFYSEIEKEVGKIYSNIVRQTLSEDFDYDVWITFGL